MKQRKLDWQKIKKQLRIIPMVWLLFFVVIIIINFYDARRRNNLRERIQNAAVKTEATVTVIGPWKNSKYAEYRFVANANSYFGKTLHSYEGNLGDKICVTYNKTNPIENIYCEDQKLEAYSSSVLYESLLFMGWIIIGSIIFVPVILFLKYITGNKKLRAEITSSRCYLATFFFLASCGNNTSNNKETATSQSSYNEPHRPQIHFSPAAKWMNDPNGMVFFNNTYHLFYQYYPDSTVWGPMHWGHAISKDVVHWEHMPIALYPDSLGYIFSGSAVVDINNTSGLGKDGKPPMIAIFTHHDTVGLNARRNDFQNQSIAYSLDEGKTWTKYANNPVVKNPGIVDFRDPKVMWFEEQQKWVMTLATKDRITFYSSKNLVDWTKESEFGEQVGAHGGVWECPDLFPLNYNGEKIWVLLVSINPGGPNKGSATQYFTGKFDGKNFTPFHTEIRWIDHGPDDYAGVTWSNTGDRKIFLGWMSNWQYADRVPTSPWRSAMTVPRDLGIKKIGDRYFVTARPVPELSTLKGNLTSLETYDFNSLDLATVFGKPELPAMLDISSDSLQSFTYMEIGRASSRERV